MDKKAMQRFRLARRIWQDLRSIASVSEDNLSVSIMVHHVRDTVVPDHFDYAYTENSGYREAYKVFKKSYAEGTSNAQITILCD